MSGREERTEVSTNPDGSQSQARDPRTGNVAGLSWTTTSWWRMALALAVAAVVVTVDQVTTTLAERDLAGHSIHVLGPLSLKLEYNSGAAFSLGRSLTWELAGLAAAMVVILVFVSRRAPSIMAAVAVGLVLGGAAGNLADRLFRGHDGAVVDFIYTTFWPTFNVADSCIVIGGALLVVVFLRSPAKRRSPPSHTGTRPEVGNER